MSFESRFDALDDRDPFVVSQDKKYGWDPDEIWLYIPDFLCWGCKYQFCFNGGMVRVFKSEFYSLLCPNCGLRNFVIDAEQQNEAEDLNDIEGII